MRDDGQAFDYVIVGGGSAGCVLADRLSADGRHRVCLLEAGPRDRNPLIRMPTGIIPLVRGWACNWKYWTFPPLHLFPLLLSPPLFPPLFLRSIMNAQVKLLLHAYSFFAWASGFVDGCWFSSPLCLSPFFPPLPPSRLDLRLRVEKSIPP